MNLDSFDLGRRIGDLDARCERVEHSVAAMSSKLDVLVLAAAERKGEKRVIAFFATAMGGVGSLVVSILLKLWGN